MVVTTRLAAALLAVLCLASGFPQHLSRNRSGFCESQPNNELLSVHKNIVNSQEATMAKIARGEQFIQDALGKGHSALQSRTPSMQVTKRATGELITLDAWVHVVYNANNTVGGYITEETILEQMIVLNKAFDPSNLAFKLVGKDWTFNESWANKPSVFERDMKMALHKGDSRTLNLYFVPGLTNGGACVFPNMNAWGKEALAMDGCMIGSFTVPGSNGTHNMGYQAVHEVGHWFGLLHTFQGGCDDKEGDYISDTPAEARDNWEGCVVSRDTCPDLPGKDPIQNYMDYSPDSCKNNFTPEQTKRMRSILSLIRLGDLSTSLAE